MKFFNIKFLILLLMLSCSSQEDSILISKKGEINFLEGSVQIDISSINSNKLKPYIFKIFNQAMPDVRLAFLSDSKGESYPYSAKVIINERFKDYSSRNYTYPKCIDFNFKKFKCLESVDTRVYCSKNTYSTDMSIFVYFNSQRILLDRRLIVSEDEDCSENNPSPLNYYDLAIQNDYLLAEVIVEQIALGMLSN